MARKSQTAFRLTIEAKELLRQLAQSKGVSFAAVVEMAIREKAQRDGIHNPHLDNP